MGEVFAGSVRESGASVAVKILKPELVSDPEVVARFVQERAILTSIDDPHVVRVIDLVIEGDTLGIVMELVAGMDLRRFLRDQRTVPPAEAVRLTCQLLTGLATVHASGIIHRDIKPENLLLDVSSGQAILKLTDFGVARLSYGASLTKLTTLIGTPEYMAPELADHDSAGPAADLYSVGIVLYEMLCGRTPFAGGHPVAVLRRQVEQAPPQIPGVPPGLWDQVTWMLAKDPLSRPRSAAEAAAALAPLETVLGRLPALPLAAPWPAAFPGIGASEGAAGPAQQATVLRHRDRGDSAAEGASPGHKDSRWPQPIVPVARSLAPERHQSRLRSRLAVAVLAAVLALVVAAAWVMLRRSPQSAVPAARPLTAASYLFAPQQYQDGLLIQRQWTLSGRDGSLLTERITASSATGHAIQAQFREAIPAAIAVTVQTVHFTPAPTKIIQADPLVEWQLRLPAHGSITLGYHVEVSPAGANHARLARWAQALQVLLSRPPTAVPGSRYPSHSAVSPTATSSAAVSSLATAPSGNAPASSAVANPPIANPTTSAPAPTSVVIPLGAACKWAYPGQATGSISGSGNNVACLDASGQSLGGFPDGSGHSLNDWCADPAHTQGNQNLIQAKLTASGWVCTTVQ